MIRDHITGIQQIGIGVTDADEAAQLYRTLFGMKALVFDDASEALLMTQYTGGDVYRRRALLTVNMQGGGGFEIWQFLNRKPVLPDRPSQYGAPGIFAAIIKCNDIHAAHKYLRAKSGIMLSSVQPGAHNGDHCWVRDAFGNTFQIKGYDEHFNGIKSPVGGVLGAVIGVSNMDKALSLYRDILCISEMVSDITGRYSDNPQSREIHCRRVLLQKKPCGRGAFGKLLGTVQLELVQLLDSKPKKMYDNRYWGDPGFIHLCFDVLDMESLKTQAACGGFPFTVDSHESFPMEGAAGRFCYLEDADGTLIELVETHKVPILKKWNVYLNLKKRGIEKPLPDWMVKMLGWSKVK